MEPEFRRGTPTKAEHEAHAYEINGERRSTWLVKGFLFIAITDGENWWIKPTEPNQGEGWFWVAMPWWPSGEEEWCPCKQGRPIAWAPSRRPEHAVALRAEGDAEVRAWSCGTCGAVYGAAQRHLAAICHGPHQCEWHAGCDAETPKNRLYCAKHDVEHEAEKRRQAFEAAEKVDGSDYHGWVFWDADPEGDGFHASLAELAAHCRYFDTELPEYVWACYEKRPQSDAADIIDNVLSDHHEGAYANITAAHQKLLQQLLDLWWRDTGIVSYEPEKTVAVIVRDARGSTPEAREAKNGENR